MTTIQPASPGLHPRRSIVFAFAMLLALSAHPNQAVAQRAGNSVPKASADKGSWVRSGAVFLVVSAVGGYAFYFGLFPRLLRKEAPNWPLDAWRSASYGAWITTCLAAYAFKTPLYEKALGPLLRGGPPIVKDYFMEMILLPLLALLGLIVIWNFRRDTTGRAGA